MEGRMISIPTTTPINGGQLLKELSTALGAPLGITDLTCYDDHIELNVLESARAVVLTVLAAHVPRTRKTVTDVARARINSMAGTRAIDLTAAQVRDLLLGIACILGALDSQGRVLPFDRWGADE